MKVLFSICSEGVSVDRYTNKLSIFSVIDKVASSSFPFWLPRLCVSIAARKDEGDPAVLTAKLKVLLNGSPIAETNAMLPFQADGTARVVLNSQLTIPSPGVVTLRLDTQDANFELAQINVSQIAANDLPKVDLPGVHALVEDAPDPR